MSEGWLAAAPAVIVAALLLTAPAPLVVLAGWRPRRVWPLSFYSPAMSVGIIELAAAVAPIIGQNWSLLPVALSTDPRVRRPSDATPGWLRRLVATMLS